MNTIEQVSVRYLVFQEEGTWYAVALEFNIVESGDDPDGVLFLLFEAIRGYVNAAGEAGFKMNALLNQESDEEYLNLWNLLNSKGLIPSPYAVYTYGTAPLVAHSHDRGLNNWNFSDVARFLREHGFRVNRVQGSHYHFAGITGGIEAKLARHSKDVRPSSLAR